MLKRFLSTFSGPPAAPHNKMSFTATAPLFNLANLAPNACALFPNPNGQGGKKPSVGLLNSTTIPNHGKVANVENFNRRNDDDSTKRDGDLLQQIDAFINSTASGEEASADTLKCDLKQQNMIVQMPDAIAGDTPMTTAGLDN